MITVGKVFSTAAKVAGTVVVGGIGIVAKTLEEGISRALDEHGSSVSEEKFDNAYRLQSETESISDMCFNCVKGIWSGNKEQVSDAVEGYLQQHMPVHDEEDEEDEEEY